MVVSSKIDIATIELIRSRNRMVNPYISTKMKRSPRKITPKFSKLNVIGVRREPEEIFPDSFNLQSKIRNFSTKSFLKKPVKKEERKNSFQMICENSEDEKEENNILTGPNVKMSPLSFIDGPSICKHSSK